MKITVRKKTIVILRDLSNNDFNKVLKWLRQNKDSKIIEYSAERRDSSEMFIIDIPVPAQFILEIS